MADKKKNRKPMTSRNKGLIVLAILLALTVCVSWIAITGLKKDGAGVNVLRAWLPLTAGSFNNDNVRSAALTLDVSLGGGQYSDNAYENSPEPTLVPTATPEPTAEPEAEAAPETEAAPEATTAPEAGSGNAAVEEAPAAGEATPAAGEAAAEKAAPAAEEAAPAAEEAATAEPTAEPTPVPTAAPADVEKAAAVIRSRINMTGYEANVAMVNGNVRVTVPNYVNINASEDIGNMLMQMAMARGQVQVKDANDTVIADNDAFTSYKIEYRQNSYGTGSYYAAINLTPEARKLFDNAGNASIYVDGTLVNYLQNVYVDGRVYMGANTESQAHYFGALFVSSPLPLSNVRVGMYETPAPGGTLNVILIVMWVLFLLAAVYMIVKNHMAGIGGAWALWLFMVFMFFLIATVALPVMNLICWIAVILCLCAAAYAAVCQLKGMDEAIAQGRDARPAVRAGFSSSLKHVLIVHGVWLAVSLLLMILKVTRPVGNILCCGMIASLVSVVGLMRWFVPCLVSVAGDTKSSVSAKAGK
ncbi:MAG: hypothetical protein IKI84_06460 [Clostridia bacterium]|nr:hypothetical protein [Clostridia bacterium]